MCSIDQIVYNSAIFASKGSYYEHMDNSTFLVYDNYEWHEYSLMDNANKLDDIIIFKLNLDKCIGTDSTTLNVYRLMEYLHQMYKCPQVCLCPPKLGIRPYPLYSSIVRTILRQMIKIEVVRAIEKKLYQRYQGFPAPEDLSRMRSIELQHRFGLSKLKATAIIETSYLFSEGVLSEGDPPSEVRAHLLRVKGIGEWTIALGLIGAGYWNMIPEKYYKRDCWIDNCRLIPSNMVTQPARVYLWAVSIFLKDFFSGREGVDISCSTLKRRWHRC